MASQNYNITQIAEEFNVNIGTVSRALNDKPGVGKVLRRKIQKRARELNYRPNSFARVLITNQTNIIGVLGAAGTKSLLDNPFWGRILTGIESAAHEAGYDMIFSDLTSSGNGEAYVPGFLKRRRVDGVILISTIPSEILDLIKEENLPACFIDTNETSGYDAVVLEQRNAAISATEHLISCGHQHIAYFGTPHRHANIQARYDGFIQTMKHNGLNAYSLSLSDSEVLVENIEGERRVLKKLLARHPEITAIFMENDYMALTGSALMASLGIRVPEQMSVMGFDDLYFSETHYPPLTTVRVPKRMMGRTAFEILYKRINGSDEEKQSPARTVTFPGELVMRETIAQPRNGLLTLP